MCTRLLVDMVVYVWRRGNSDKPDFQILISTHIRLR